VTRPHETSGCEAVGPCILTTVNVTAMGNGSKVNHDVDFFEQRRPIHIVLKIGQLHPFDTGRACSFRRPARRRTNAVTSLSQCGGEGRPDKTRGTRDQYPKWHPLPDQIHRWSPTPQIWTTIRLSITFLTTRV
jgi:hypothetical protein